MWLSEKLPGRSLACSYNQLRNRNVLPLAGEKKMLNVEHQFPSLRPLRAILMGPLGSYSVFSRGITKCATLSLLICEDVEVVG